MARKPREQEQTETLVDPYQTTVSHSGMEIVDTTAELVNPAPWNPSAAGRDGGTVEVAPPQQYRVVANQYAMSKGGRTLLRAGKMIDGNNFDLVALRSQGVQLEEVG